MSEEEMQKVDEVKVSGFDSNVTPSDDEKMVKYVANLKREIEQNTKKIEFHEKLLKDMLVEKAARLENHDIIIANFKPLNPQWEFEKDENYLKNLAIIQGILKMQDTNKYEDNEKQIVKVIDVAKEQLQSLVEALAKIEDTDVKTE